MGARQLADFTAACRLSIGAAFVLAPRWAMRPWIGSRAEDPGTRLLARALGARDLALAVGTLTAGGRERRRPWLIAALSADAADLALTLAAGRQLPRRGRALVCVIAGAGVSLGVVALSSRRPPPEPSQ
jgi:hypothetical protein